MFVNTLKNMPDRTLEQVKRGWPGLAKEATTICQDLELPNIIVERIGKRNWESMVKKAAKEKHEEELKEEVHSKTKLAEIQNEDMKRKDYFHQKIRGCYLELGQEW